ncbi:MAG TPA: hypothetical protein VH763_17045 [Gemmatimonadales bacterium]
MRDASLRLPLPVAVLGALVYLLALPSPSTAQTSLVGFSTLRLTGGVAITLPEAWHRVDAATESKINGAMDTIFPKVKDSVFQAAMSRGRPIQLLNATDGEHPVRSLNLNAAPAPGATAATFADASDEELARALSPLCPTIGQLLAQAKGRLISCSKAERRLVGGRVVALTRYVRTGPSGFVSVWLVQYPEDNVLYSLTLNAPQADEKTVEPVYRGIWESLAFGQ